jgi:hypothetical protein
MSPPPQVLDLRAFRADRPGLGCRFSVVPPGYPQGVSTPIIDRRSPCPTQPHARGPAATPAAQWGFAVSGFEGVLVPYAALPQHGAVPYATRWGRVARSRCVLGIVSAKHAPCGGTGGPLGSRCKVCIPANSATRSGSNRPPVPVETGRGRVSLVAVLLDRESPWVDRFGGCRTARRVAWCAAGVPGFCSPGRIWMGRVVGGWDRCRCRQTSPSGNRVALPVEVLDSGCRSASGHRPLRASPTRRRWTRS